MGGKRKRFWGHRGEHKTLGVAFESGLERRFLDQCYLQGIKVERCLDKVPYVDEAGKSHLYTPDFYLPDFKFVIEIKGTWTFKANHGFVREKFFAAREYFKGRYMLITEKELKQDIVAKLHRDLVNGY